MFKLDKLAKSGDLPVMITYRKSTGELVELPTITASEAKNRFGMVFDQVLTEGPIAVSRHEKPSLVILSVGEFERLKSPESPAIRELDLEYDKWFDDLQGPEARDAMESAFNAMPGQSGDPSRAGS